MTSDRHQFSGWMDQASRGDDEAFGRLAFAAQDDLYRFALAQGLASHDAAEAVQEALLRAYRSRRDWRKGADAATWLCGITLNVVREMRRAKRRDRESPLDPEALAALADTADRSEQTLSHLAEAIDALPPRQREAVVCRYLRRLSVRDTAIVMGCADGTVKAALATALENLRKCGTLGDTGME
jgi:RNA polymerase sigma-70 factor, ECF subfamily